MIRLFILMVYYVTDVVNFFLLKVSNQSELSHKLDLFPIVPDG